MNTPWRANTAGVWASVYASKAVLLVANHQGSTKRLALVYPPGRWDGALAREELRGAGERGVEARVAGGRRGLAQQCDPAGAGRSPEVVREPEQQSQSIALPALSEILGDHRRELLERRRAAAHPRARVQLEVVLTGIEQPLQRREGGRAGPRLVGGDRRLCGVSATRHLCLRDARGPTGVLDELCGLHEPIIYISI